MKVNIASNQSEKSRLTPRKLARDLLNEIQSFVKSDASFMNSNCTAFLSHIYFKLLLYVVEQSVAHLASAYSWLTTNASYSVSSDHP